MQEVIRVALEEVLADMGLSEVVFVVEHPSDLANGDYSCNVAMVLARQLGKAPRIIAEQFCIELKYKIEYVDRVEVAGAGFINFYLSRDFFANEINRAVAGGGEWGSNNTQKGEVVLLEYTSPNLFKPLHIGNLVGNIIGESLSRLFEFSGADLKRLNYPSDIGPTVAKGVWGLKTHNLDPQDISALGEAYRLGNEAYENNPEFKVEIDNINKALYERSDEKLVALYETGIATSKRSLAEMCAVLGTKFDAEFTESQASSIGAEIVRSNIGKVFKESEGAVVYEGEKVGLHTRVFLNSKGLPTYEAKDLGNFTLKQNRYPDWTQSLVVTGNEQREYFKVLFASIKELFTLSNQQKLEHIPTGFLTLTTGKMSSRKGNVFTGTASLAEIRESAREKAENTRTDNLEEMIDMVAVGALKYQILRQSPGSDIVYDKEKSLSFEGDSGPYLQYTHARIGSVLEKAEQVGLVGNIKSAPEIPYTIERLIYQFPEVIEEALKERAPHKVVGFLTELAGEFNSFYGQEKIADTEDVHAPYKIMVARAVKITIKNGLWVLGIKAPDRM